MVAAALLCLAAACAGAEPIEQGKTLSENSSEILADSLRRLLMKDNYDYMSTESDEPQAQIVTEQNGSDQTVSKEQAVTYTIVNDTEIKKRNKELEVTQKNKRIADKLKDRSRSYSNRIYTDDDLKHIVDGKFLKKLARRRKKVQNYMKEIDEDMAKRYRSRYRYKVSDEDNSVTDHDIEQTTTIKYKVLKLRSPYRRNGHAAALIQEESPDGVSIVKLGIGPFPEFRLPHLRRQYMGASRPLQAGIDDDDELPPPPAHDTAEADQHTLTERLEDMPTTGHAVKPYFNDGQNSLKITVTPDEIFVL